MSKRMYAMLLLVICAGCARTPATVQVNVPNDALTESVMRAEYPQDRTVFGDVYEPTDETHDLVPSLPGETAADQKKPPLLNDN